MTQCVTQDDYRVRVGTVVCEVVELSDNRLDCLLPDDAQQTLQLRQGPGPYYINVCVLFLLFNR